MPSYAITYGFTCIVIAHPFNGWAHAVPSSGEAYNENGALFTVAEYRKLMNDHTTTDERIQERIDYLVRFTRKNIKTELAKLCQK